MTTKICTKCRKEKELSKYPKDNRNKDGCRAYCKVCANKQNREWRDNNKEQMSKIVKQWYENNKERRSKTIKNWRKNNPDKHSIIKRRHNIKRKRDLGYIPINDKKPGDVGHHVNRELVVYMPEWIHKSIPHSQNDPTSMEEINILAMEYV